MPSVKKSKGVPLDQFHAHEALDRSNMLVEIIDQQLLTHPYIKADPKKVALVEKATKALFKLYQQIGYEHLKPM